MQANPPLPIHAPSPLHWLTLSLSFSSDLKLKVGFVGPRNLNLPCHLNFIIFAVENENARSEFMENTFIAKDNLYFLSI